MSLSDRPTAMTSEESEEQDAVRDLNCVRQSKTTPNDIGDIDTVWQSMYEKSLGRKVSEYWRPPQAVNELKDDNSSTSEAGSSSTATSVELESETADKKQKDFARVHLERALNLGKLSKDDVDGRRWRRRTYSNSSTGEQGHVEHQDDKHD